MAGPGVENRLQLLRQAADQQLLKPLETHGWAAKVESENPDGEYFVIEASKESISHKIALLYTSATANGVYKRLDGAVEHIFTNGELYRIEQYAYGISTPVSPVGDFFPVLVGWNKQIAPGVIPQLAVPRRPRLVRDITAENPLAGIWSRLDQFGSVVLAEKLILRRASESGITLTQEATKSKASGVAFSLRNASDYLRASSSESLNKRILSLYYGILALAFAEMLSSPTGPRDLDEVEGMTKQGHGLYTVPSATEDFGGLNVGVLATGFFPHWMSFLGADTSAYSKKKAKSPSDLDNYPTEAFTTLRELLSTVPELGDLFLEVYPTEPSWVTLVYQVLENRSGPGSNKASVGSSYIHILDKSGRVDMRRFGTAGWAITEIVPVSSASEGKEYRARVDHAGLQFWYEALILHRSPYLQSPALVIPVIDHIAAYRVNAVIVLYALSIVVRYMPSAWRRIEGGDWDEHLSLIKSAVSVYERVLPEQFLETIIGEGIHASQPGSFF